MTLTPLDLARAPQSRICDTQQSPRDEIVTPNKLRGSDQFYSIEKSHRSRVPGDGEVVQQSPRVNPRSPKRLAAAVTAQPSPRAKNVVSGELNIMAAPTRPGMKHEKAIGSWMMNSTARDGGFVTGQEIGTLSIAG